jgi:cytochrome b6-f complex iron-sulfur subunit
MAESTDRRGFLELVIKGSALVIGAVTAIPAVGMLLSPILYRPASLRKKLIFAQPGDASSTTFVMARLEGQDEAAPGVFYKRGTDGAPIVISSVCTHAGCAVTWKAQENKFFCPCHQGSFDSEGINIAGPPPRPLTRLVSSVHDGDILVEEPAA